MGGASKGKRGSAHCHRIELEETDASFPFRTKLVGEGGANLKHIQENCACNVKVSREQPLSIDISAETSKSLDRAVKMTEDLVSAIWDEYSSERKRGSKGSSKGKTKDRGSDKGKGKSAKVSDREP